MKLLAVGSRIMYNNKPATIKEINSDGTFDVEDNEGNIKWETYNNVIK